MSITLQFEQMKMAVGFQIKTPSDLNDFKNVAFDKAWEFVTKYFKDADKSLPKAKHGKPSFAVIKDGQTIIDTDELFKSCLAKGVKTFQVNFNVPSHIHVPFVIVPQ